MTVETIVSITLIGANVCAIFAGLFGIAKLVWHLSKLDSKAEEAKNTAIRAHRRIDDIEKYWKNGRA